MLLHDAIAAADAPIEKAQTYNWPLFLDIVSAFAETCKQTKQVSATGCNI